ncbi:MAG: hypothetical protein ACAH11_12670 [Sphingomonas sp.]
MIGLALILAFAVPQDTEVKWEAVPSGNPDLTIEVSDLRTEGDVLHFTVRVASPKTKRAMVLPVDLDCGEKTSKLAGDGSVYEDGVFSSTMPTPSRFLQYAPVAADPIAGPLANHLCK